MMEVEIDLESFRALRRKELKVVDALKNVNDVHLNLHLLSKETGLPYSTVWDQWQKIKAKCRMRLVIEPLSVEERLRGEENGEM